MDTCFLVPIIFVVVLVVISIIASIVDPDFFEDNDDFYFL